MLVKDNIPICGSVQIIEYMDAKLPCKNKLLEAFEDRSNQGFVWNNIMLSRWVDHEGKEHRVKEDYERNKELIDLTRQPDHIKQISKVSV